MKNKIIGIILSFLCLYFSLIPQYEEILFNLSKERVLLSDITKDEEQEDTESKDSEKDPLKNTNSAESDSEETENLKLYAQSAVLMDADSGRVLYEKNGNEEMPMASTTKIMTCIVTLENADLDDTVTVSKYASTMPDVQLKIREGEQYKLIDLLYSLMLESHNDVAVAIAEHVGGSVEGFAAMMNAKAIELGCEHTNFVTPNGLDSAEHYTTAVELSKIASYAIKNEDFVKITNTTTWQFSELTKGRTFNVSNKDRFLYLYDGAIGIKTGFTGKAGYCFVGAVEKDNKTLVSTVLACGWPPNKNYKWSDTVELMDYGVDNYEVKQIFDGNKEFNPVTIVNGKENKVGLYYSGDITLLMRKDEKVNVIYKIPSVMTAPVKADMVVGSAKYYIGEDLISEVPILTKSSIDKIDYKYCLEKIIDIWQHFK